MCNTAITAVSQQNSGCEIVTPGKDAERGGHSRDMQLKKDYAEAREKRAKDVLDSKSCGNCTSEKVEKYPAWLIWIHS